MGPMGEGVATSLVLPMAMAPHCSSTSRQCTLQLFQALFSILLRRSLAFDLVAIIAVLKLRMILTAKSAYSSGIKTSEWNFCL